MSRVLVVDTQLNPLHPCTPARARLLLKQHKASVLRRFPFTIVLRAAVPETQPSELRLKLDPGSRTTGLAVVDDATGEVVWAAEVRHRGEQVQKALTKRKAARRFRRERHTRYREVRFVNRRRPRGWLSPSLRSRLDNLLTWVARLRKWCPIAALSVEIVKFDTQLLQTPELAGEDYQFGTLAGCELREYVLAKWNYTCAYCGVAGVPLELDHVLPRSRGGSNRASNRVAACHSCNQQKGNSPIEEYLHDKPATFQRIQKQLKAPLSDAAAMNSLRRSLFERLQTFGLPLETSSGGRTKWNRTQLGLPKTHWLDAACVGATTPTPLRVERVIPLHITATGRQQRQMVLMDKCGFPRSRAKSGSCVGGFRTGDVVRATVSKGKRVGVYSGRVSVRTRGYFDITTKQGRVQGVAIRDCRNIQRADGYHYQKGEPCYLQAP